MGDLRTDKPAWSPDGKWIAFRDADEGTLGLIREDGSARSLLLPSDIGAAGPQWSPDGRRLAFFTADTRDIWVTNVDGTGLRNLTPSTKSIDVFPAWSPDGRFITFVSDRDGAFRLYTMKPDGSGVRRFIDIEIQGEGVPDWGPRP